MSKIVCTLITLLAVTSVCYAEVPEKLIGTWSLNRSATESYMKKSPNPPDAKLLQKILDETSNMKYIFTKTSMISEMGKRKHEMKLTLKSEDKEQNIFILIGNHKGKEITFTAAIDKDGNLNLKSSATNRMDYLLWKK